MFKAKFVYESDEKYLKDALHVCAGNELVMKKNEVVLNDLSDEVCTIDFAQFNCKHPLAKNSSC